MVNATRKRSQSLAILLLLAAPTLAVSGTTPQINN